MAHSSALSAPEPEASPARSLLTAAAVRERAHALLDLALQDRLDHLAVDLDRLGPTAEAVIETTLAAYPTLDIPFHARWRHFAVGGLDRWGTVGEAFAWADPAARARSAFDLAIVSVLLDAGAGPDWAYQEGRTDELWGRSEGLAVASFDMFVGGAFSGDLADPLRADAGSLTAMDAAELGRGFQVRVDNPLVGLSGRAELLQRLGRAVSAAPDVFATVDEPRPGGLYDHLVAGARGGTVAATDILEALLVHLGPVWPGRLSLDGLDLGDTWRHPAAPGEGETAGLVPFHKLSQWLTHSLVEPLEAAGVPVVGLDGLTGLPEYRNGGLLLDTGLLRLRDPGAAAVPHEVGSPLVVEWRALTVALLDRLADEVRARLGRDAAALPLARILEGGTWATGRRLAREKRPGGPPPLTVISDGTVF